MPGKGWEFSYTVGSGRHSRNGRFVSSNPYLFQTFAGAMSEQILRDILATLPADVSDYVRDRIRAGIYTWSQNLYRNVQSREDLEQMHQRVSEGVHKAIMTAFDQSSIGKKRPSYRWNDNFGNRRYANKRLKRAIHNPELVGYDYKGIFFPNTELLDKEAPQWYRLNFGTEGEVSNPQPKALRNMMWGKRPTNVNINFGGYKPSAAFFVPQSGQGYWSSTFSNRGFGKSNVQLRRIIGSKATNRNGALYITHLPGLGFESKLSKGIVGTRFLDKGANYLNRMYGSELSWLLEVWFQEALLAGKLEAGKRGSISPFVRARMNGTEVTQSELKAARTKAGHNSAREMSESTVGQMSQAEFLERNPNWFDEEAVAARIRRGFPAGFFPYVQ